MDHRSCDAEAPCSLEARATGSPGWGVGAPLGMTSRGGSAASWKAVSVLETTQGGGQPETVEDAAKGGVWSPRPPGSVQPGVFTVTALRAASLPPICGRMAGRVVTEGKTPMGSAPLSAKNCTPRRDCYPEKHRVIPGGGCVCSRSPGRSFRKPASPNSSIPWGVSRWKVPGCLGASINIGPPFEASASNSSWWGRLFLFLHRILIPNQPPRSPVC